MLFAPQEETGPTAVHRNDVNSLKLVAAHAHVGSLSRQA